MRNVNDSRSSGLEISVKAAQMRVFPLREAVPGAGSRPALWEDVSRLHRVAAGGLRLGPHSVVHRPDVQAGQAHRLEPVEGAHTALLEIQTQ